MSNNEIQNLPEAPASATLSVITPKGYPTLFTLREMTGQTLLTKITAVEAKLEALGYKPQVRSFGGFTKKPVEYVKGFMCPKCSSRLVEKTKKDGGKFWKCEKSKWDVNTRRETGCDYIDWNAGAVAAQPARTTATEEPLPQEDF